MAAKAAKAAKESAPRKLRYSVHVHTPDEGMRIIEPIDADSGDEAALKALAKANDPSASVRSVQPYLEPSE